MKCPDIKSIVRRKINSQGIPYFVVIHKVGNKRILQDCEHFLNRQAAKDMIPELDNDLKLSIEKGIL